ncbi:unnamed protein product [Phytophthora fragariaefolia]|uniref:Unnamed protein product n=1 Tax=Phytophthora fragariaefolia TaxID=1490495 RepID=A0A9W6XPI6_9STRA|nr:unnamed protein product [Phytophthora fragariaefolia]
MVSNVMKVLPVFYSDTATMEKARDFWELFEAHTAHLPDQSRLLVFHQKIKGRPAERWWNNSTIKTFATLKVRFHNQFLSRTADELWERLQTTKRERGESVVEWGDRVSDLCDSLDYPNPQMRYQLFRRGLRNKRMLATLDSGPARDIPEACEWLLAKEMSCPIEEDDEFPEEKKSAGTSSSSATASPTETSTKLDKLAETMSSFVALQQQWQQQMRRNQWQPPRSPRNRMPNVSATTSSPGAGGHASPGNGRPRGIREERVSPSSCLSNGSGSGGRDRDEVKGTVLTVNVCMKASAEQDGTVPAGDEVSYGESKDEIKKKGVKFIVVSTDNEGEDLAVTGDELQRKEVYEDLGLSAIGASIELKDWVASADDLEASGGVEHGPVELAAELIDSPCGEEIPEETSRAVSVVSLGDEPGKDPVIGEVAQEAEAPTPFADEPPPYIWGTEDVYTEEVPEPFADAPPPYEWGDDACDLSDCLFSTWTEEETGPVEAVAKNGTVPLKTTTASNYDRLFSDEKLITMENAGPGQEASVLAGADVVSEPEEYDKGLEDRLYPLDEVELLRRVAMNVEAQAEPSSEELARILGISLEVLERMRQASSDLHGSPEYWQGWFEGMLDKSEEAKRANRDFRSPVASVFYGPPLEAAICSKEPPPASGVMSEGERESVPTRDIAAEERVVVESVVAENVVRPPDDPGGTVAVAEAVPVLSEVRGVDPKVARAEARHAVFRFFKEARSYGDSRSEASGPPEGRGTVKVPPLRNKVPEFDEGRLLWHVDRVKELTGVKARSGERLRFWMSTYFADNSRRIWLELWNRTGRSKALSARRRRRRHPNKVVTFTFSSLYKPYAEAIGDVKLFPEHDEDASHYVEVVRCERPARSPLPKTGLVDVVTVNLPNGFGVYDDDGADDLVCRVVEDGRRVVCAVGNFEALSSGYIDCLPSQMLVDTGATLRLVDRRVLKRLGRSSGPLEPYEGLVRSSSGHKLRTRGWIRLALRLGSKEISLSLLVADKLHVDAILGVDALGAFGAVIDVAERSLTLKGSGEVLPLGFTVVQESYITAMATSVRLPPRGQALVRTRVVGDVAEKAVVLVEGSLGLPPSLCVARTLCTVEDGLVVVEVCNASTDECWIRRGTVVASASVIPASAFNPEATTTGGTVTTEDEQSVEAGVKSVSEEREEGVGEKVKASKPDVPPDKGSGMKADFSQSKLSSEQKELFQAELDCIRSLFVESLKKPGRTDLLQFEIDTDDSAPIKQPPYRVSLTEGEIMEAEIQQYLELNLIRPSNSPWASPVLMIRKPDGGIRFCIDYRKLNSVTVKDRNPMPLIDDILDVLGDAQLFSTMDIASGYWNVPMHPDSVSKTAFTCKYGLYEWLVMHFGLCNAVPAFERLMETVLVDLKWRICLVYLDDCVVFSKDFPTHLVRIRQVLTRFQQAGIKLKMKRCHWGRSQVVFWGHIVTPTGILPNPEKVKAVLNVKRPVDIHGIRSFLGLTSYFRRYIPGYASISAPLERLKVKDAPFEWNEDCEGDFRRLKRDLMKPPILVYPDGRKRFKLYVDSSRYAVGACLMQEVDGRDRVFDLYTDHQALTWVFSPGNRATNSKLARWAMELSSLQFKVHHKPGVSMGHVDGLSRLPVNTVAALSLRDLLNPEDTVEDVLPTSVGEQAGAEDDRSVGGERADGHIDDEYPDRPNEVMSGDAVGNPPRTPVDRFGLDLDQFVQAQQEVPWVKALVAFLLDGALPLDPLLRATIVKMRARYEVLNGMLMRKVHLRARVGPARSLTVPVVPLPYVETVLHYCHADVLSSHLGLTKTLEKVRRHAFWPGWRRDVTEYVRECARCGSGKGSRPGQAGQMQRMPVADLTGPFSMLVVDAVGPLPVAERGNKYILVFVDYFTRWAEAFAVSRLDSVTFVEVKVNGAVARHGVPSRLLSDQGRNFTSEIAKSFYQTLGIKKLYGSAYHPQTQGLVERFNGTFMGMLKMHVSESQTDWDLYLPRVLFAYRTAYHEALGDSPFFSLYGRDPVLPLDVAFLNLGRKWKSNEVAVYRRELYRTLRDSRHLVEHQLLKAQDRHEQRLGDRVAVQYEIGDPVWVYQLFRKKRGESRTKKLAFSWHGPYRVVGKIGENAYRTDIPAHPGKVVTVNVNRLKKFRGRWTRPYMDEVPEEVVEDGEEVEDGPLEEADLPPSSFAERVTIGRGDTALLGVSSPLLEIVAKRVVDRAVGYLVLTANYESHWVPRADVMPEYGELVTAFEQAERKKRHLPELRRSSRLEEANAEVGDDDLLMA